MNLKEFTEKQYRKFSNVNGSQYIASEYALWRILKIIQIFKPKEILEIGAGIGTICDSILKRYNNENYNLNVSAIESDQFCIQQLELNLGNEFNRLYLTENLSNLRSGKFDLIIPDFTKIKTLIKDDGIILVEGDRKEQVNWLREQYSSALFAHSVSMWKNSKYSNRPTDELRGGVKLFFLKPGFMKKMYWLFLKIDAKIKFELRYKL
jgi:hypothetical protein